MPKIIEIDEEDLIKTLKKLDDAGGWIDGEWNHDAGCWKIVNFMCKKYKIEIETDDKD